MRLSYHADTDSLYIHLVEHPGVEAREVATGVVVDFDANGKPVGIDIDHAQNILDLTTLEAESLPVKIMTA
ncbi:DUF2283 domain-containing protein [Dehalococcoidia bacterium]|nr:DUF2283 domain-containing protein [Dehalococcoidia bacterium]MCL0074193.1 DUF2283 domain-containing protein [Dehalococcoidia bacterium]MCL0075875.1 DUF2283 domain-containing protein [Dehalococcoidia bacterium]